MLSNNPPPLDVVLEHLEHQCFIIWQNNMAFDKKRTI